MSKSENRPQEKYVLTITAENVVSTDPRFTMDNLSLGDNYRPLDAYYEKGDGDIIRRNYVRGERKNTNQTLPRIACQVFEKQLSTLPVEDKENFPICKYNPNSSMIRGIFRSVDEFKKSRNTIEYLTYGYDEGRQFVIYCWNIFTTIIFVKECLKRFGEPGDKFVLIYRDKERGKPVTPPDEDKIGGYRNPFSSMLIESKNLIFRGAPGTGKSYLAKEIAADIISNGYFDDCDSLSDEQKKQVEFVQFHPSYDYSDFVEGLRPKLNEDGTMGFELKDGQLQTPCPLESIPDLREWHLGKLEGLKITTLNAIYPQQIKAFRSNLAQFDTRMFEAESLYSTTQRTIQFIKSLKGSPAENILIVGHGANLTASLRTLLGYKEAHLRKDGGLANASLTILDTEDFETFTLERWNDTSYQRK